MKVSVLTLGCKVNKYESDSLLNQFASKGYEISDKLEMADIYVINTCAVTSEAERKSRQMIARCKKFNPQAKVYVCGCAAQASADQFKCKADGIMGVAQKNSITCLPTGVNIAKLPKDYEMAPYAIPSRTRAYIKVQDGCNNFCSYCIIPYLRGRSRSRDMEDIIKEATLLKDKVQEIVLTGINLSDYRIDGKLALLKLLQELDKLDVRLRLSSMEEVIANNEFIEGLSRLKNFCPHFHLSLQSGSKSVLKRMNRRYSPQEFAAACALIRKYFPLASITTDVIVGFPQETQEEFEETYEFIKQVGFSGLHVFSYSRRPGTVAARMVDLSSDVKKIRSARLFELDKKLRRDFILKNETGQVLIEESSDGVSHGFTKNYIKCNIAGTFREGEIVTVKIIGERNGEAEAEIL